MFKTFLFVGIGSFFGGGLRYLVTRWLSPLCKSGFPWATIGINICGCFLLGLLLGLFARNDGQSGLKFLLTAGFCGGFTTFSTFLNESFVLGQQGQFLYAVLNPVISLTGGLTALYIGYKLS